MTGAALTGLLIKFGPIALDWAAELASVWSKEMTPEEVEAFCLPKRKAYDQFIQQERDSRV